MIPKSISDEMLRTRGNVLRKSESLVVEELRRLGVPEHSQFGEFFIHFQVSALSSAVSKEELMDLASPAPQIRSVTEFVHGVYDVPDQFICLTSAEGEGFYLYDRDSEAVYDVGVEDVQALAARTVTPSWRDFYTFISWYLGILS